MSNGTHFIQIKNLTFTIQMIMDKYIYMLYIYGVHFMITSPGSWVSNLAGNLRKQKLHKAKKNRANIMGAHYNSWVSTESVVKFVLSFIFYFLYVPITTFFPSPWNLSAIAAAAVHHWNTMSDTADQDTIVTSAIPCSIRWTGNFFVGRSSVGLWDGDGSIESAVSILPSGTLSTFYRQLRLILSSSVSTSVILMVSLCFFCLHYPLSPSFGVSFVVPIVSPLWKISSDCVLISPRPYHPHKPVSINPLALPCNIASLPHLHPQTLSPSSHHLWLPPPPSWPQSRTFSLPR